MQACRNAVSNELSHLTEQLEKEVTFSHAGLLLDRYLEQVSGQERGGSAKYRKNLLQTAKLAVKHLSRPYTLAFERRESLWPENTCVDDVETISRMIIGLGSDSVLETGLSLHHTYGVPIIPGTALKGMAAHFAASVWKNDEPEWDIGGEYHTIVFGSSASAGNLVFHDGWIKPQCVKEEHKGLLDDILTPHHSDYYTSGNAAPTDFDDPNPANSFLSVAGTFRIAISCEDTSENGRAWCKLTMQLLRSALEHWGVGGKTSSGYGRLITEASVVEEPLGAPEVPEEDVWLYETIQRIKQEHNIPSDEQAIMSTPLAKLWDEEPDAELKAKKLVAIKRRWGEDKWNGNYGKKAKKIYLANTGQN
ncbi:type III-B CRISPR module RAMP protein Cmr6 [Teredinibacter turnerae]|uniref:type III-B CRISPR module RAMP protein Cmr6 n=1 Tax=Teredinibacter turnerae TaxID=2426 RepID=UPI0005F8151E|nr:type III-B CRISPR module RAMP protein Cmr6 [Teredinibacter turnerae]